MRRLAVNFAVCAVIFTACGCFTYRDKVAYRRAELVMVDRGNTGDDLAAACGVELGEANRDTGANMVTEAEAPKDAAAARDNARGIAVAREGRAAIAQFVVGAVKSVAAQWPGVGVAVGALSGLVVAIRKYLQYKKAAETVIEGVGSATATGASGAGVKNVIRNLAIDYGVEPLLDKMVQKIDPPQGPQP